MPPTYDGFDIISTIRSDAILYQSPENIRVNAHARSNATGDAQQFYMLSYHQERMLASAKAFGWDTTSKLLEGPEGFDRLLMLLHDHLELTYNNRRYPAPLMVRIAISADGKYRVSSNGLHPWPAATDRVPRPPFIDSASQLYPRSFSTFADPMRCLLSIRWCVFVTFNKVTPTLFTRHKTSNRWEYDKALALLPVHPAPTIVNGVQMQIEILIVNDRWEIMEGCRFTPYFRRGNTWVTPAAECGGNLGTTRRWALNMGLCEEGVVKGGSVKYNDIIVLSNGAKGFQVGMVCPWTAL